MAEVGLGRRETASKVGSRPLDSPTSSSSSPGPLNFEEVEEVSALHSRERERFLQPLSRYPFDIENIVYFEGFFACETHENSVYFEYDGTEWNFRKCS